MPAFEHNYAFEESSDKLGVLLVNLGTPSAPDTASVRRYLREFLSDPRVVEVPKPLWWFILNFFILTTRPSRSAALYRKIWQPEGSPLLINALNQAKALQQTLDEAETSQVRVAVAMRYGEPSIEQGLDNFTEDGINKILVLPMYPQYSGSTVGSVLDEVGNVLQKRRYVPSIRFTSGYSDQDSYISGLTDSVKSHWDEHGRSEVLLMSFHGIPEGYSLKGDPYPNECRKTAELLAKELGLNEKQWLVAFQSRFGPKKWLQPYTDDVLRNMVELGVSTVDVICPGFSVDCLETLEEVAIGYKSLFYQLGGKTFNYIPCLNDRPSHIHMLEDIIKSSISDWLVAQTS